MNKTLSAPEPPNCDKSYRQIVVIQSGVLAIYFATLVSDLVSWVFGYFESSTIRFTINMSTKYLEGLGGLTEEAT